MDLSGLPVENESHTREVQHDGQHGTLSGHWLLLARCAAAVLIVLLLAFFIANIPVYFAQLQTTCAHAPCRRWQLSPANESAIQHAGFSISQYATFTLTLNLLSTLIWFAIAALIAWRRSNDWLAGLASLFLITQAILTFTGIPSIPLAYSSPTWHVSTILLFLLDSLLYLLVFSLFPNGRFVPGWIVWPVITQFVLGSIVLFLPATLSTPEIFFTPLTTPLLLTSWIIIIGGQIYRYRRVSSPAERQQTRWIVFGLVVGPVVGALYYLPPLLFPSLSQPNSLYFLLFTPVFTIASLFSPLCFGIAILRYHLWDIDVIINRTLVYAGLSACVIGLYALVVVGLGALLQARGSILLSLLATGLIAILFQPLRQRLQQTVNHLLYGERTEPYQVLARLGQRLEATLTPDAVLPTIVETVAQALKLPQVTIRGISQDNTTPISLAVYGTADEQEARERIPLIYQQETVGELVLVPRKSDKSLTPADHHFLHQLAPQIGLAVHTVRLTADLKQLTMDLQDARKRLVTAREEERRRLRRDLHDGLGPQLSSQPLLLTSAQMLLQQNPEEAGAILKTAITQAQEAIGDIRRLVYALRPPTLDDLGLVAAIQEQLTRYRASGIAFRIETEAQLPPLPAAVEVACYRIVQEALANVIRHAHARTCIVRLACHEQVTIEISDDGQGLPPAYQHGVGLTSMRERTEELGGRWLIESRPDEGTCVRAEIPYR